MRTFDLIVIGTGSGLEISSEASEAGWSVAVVEEGPFGGTCLNRGCIPSKMLIHCAEWASFGAIDYVSSRGIPLERMGLLGFSLGAGVSILVAAQEPRIPAVVSDSGFLDYLMDLRKLSIGPFRLPPWFGVVVALTGRGFFKADRAAECDNR